MKIKVWDVPAFWPRDIPRPKIGDIVQVPDHLGHGMIACECGREFPSRAPDGASADKQAAPESTARVQPERAVMARPEPR